MQRFISIIVIIAFIFSLLMPTPKTQAQTLLGLPEPGSMVSLSPSYQPLLIKGITIHQDNPFLFDFILDTGNTHLSADALKNEADRLMKYFFASLTIPNKDLWVNLSPYEKDRIVPQALGETAMGRDLLAQDYILKQLTASLIYPERQLGKAFWDKVYTQAREQYGTTQIPVNTFNKVWIVAEKAKVYEHNQTAFVVSGHLKVMLEEDYLALNKRMSSTNKNNMSFPNALIGNPETSHSIASNIIRQIILPALEEEVNKGKNFAMLRQIFYSQILAVWFKANLKQALLSQLYANHSTVKGLDLKDPGINEKIYQRYLEAYKKGVYNFIKQENDPVTKENIPRKYFSGGYDAAQLSVTSEKLLKSQDAASIAKSFKGSILDLKITVAVNGHSADAAMFGELELIILIDTVLYIIHGPKILFDHLRNIKKQKPWDAELNQINEDFFKRLKTEEQIIKYLKPYVTFKKEGKSIMIVAYNPAKDPGVFSMFQRFYKFDRNGKKKLWTPFYNTLLFYLTGDSRSFCLQYISITGALYYIRWPLRQDYGHVLLFPIRHLKGWQSQAIENYYNYLLKKRNIDKMYSVVRSEKSIHLDHKGDVENQIGDFFQFIKILEEEQKKLKDTYERFPGHLELKEQLIKPMGEVKRDRAMLNNGGIDLGNLSNNLSVSKDAHGGIVMNIDQAMFAHIRREGIQSATPEIISIKTLPSLSQLLGV